MGVIPGSGVAVDRLWADAQYTNDSGVRGVTVSRNLGVADNVSVNDLVQYLCVSNVGERP